jgi:hypothetical protein
MRRRINAERHAAHHCPAVCNAKHCDASRGGEAVSARPSCANNPDRRKSQHFRVAAQPEWSTAILIWMEAETWLATFRYASIIRL